MAINLTATNAEVIEEINRKDIFTDGTGLGTAAVTTSPYSCAKWVGNNPAIKALYTGLIIWHKIGVAGNGSYGTSLNINNLGEHPVVANVNTMVSSRYAVGCIIPLIYDADGTGSLYLNSASATTVTGVWKIADYDSNTTITYGTLAYYFRPYTAETLYRYKLCAMTIDNKLLPLITTNNTAAATNLTPTATAFRPDKIYWYNTTTTIAADKVIGANTLMSNGYNATNMAICNFNSNLPTYRYVYLCGTYDINTGLFTLNGGGTEGSTAYYTFVPDNTSNITLSSYFTAGKDYILVGASYSTANYMHLREDNLLFHFDGTNLVPYDTYRANTISAEIPTKTSDLTNDSGFITDAGVTSVSLASGTNNGTLKLTVNGSSTDNIAVKGLGTAAYKSDSYFGTATAVSTAQSTADTAKSIAEGRAKAVSFATVAAMKTALAAASATEYKVGDNLFIVATDVPDYWVSKVNATQSGDYGYYEVSELETQKVDLTDYQTKTDNSLATTAKTVVGAINELNSDKANVSDIPDVSDMVTKSANQTISGTKTFDSTDTYISGFGVSKTNNLGNSGYYAFVRGNSANPLFGLRYGSTNYYLQVSASGLQLGPTSAVATTWASNGDVTMRGTNRPKWGTNNLALQSEIPTVDSIVSLSSSNAVQNSAITSYVNAQTALNSFNIKEVPTMGEYNSGYDAYLAEVPLDDVFLESRRCFFYVFIPEVTANTEPDLTKPIYFISDNGGESAARVVTPTTLYSQTGTPLSLLAKQCYYAYPYTVSEITGALFGFIGTMTTVVREDWDVIVDTPNLSNLPEASTSTAGVVTTGEQTFSGNKYFSNNIYSYGSDGLVAGLATNTKYKVGEINNQGYALTLPTKTGTLAITDQTIQELTTQYIRIWDLEPGVYKWSYSGGSNLYYYYYGATNTSNVGTIYCNASSPAIVMISVYNGAKIYEIHYGNPTPTIAFGFSVYAASLDNGSLATRPLSNIPSSAITTTTSVTSGSSALVTSGGVYTAIQNAITTALNNSY